MSIRYKDVTLLFSKRIMMRLEKSVFSPRFIPLTLCIVLFFFAACGPNDQHFRIKGAFKKLSTAQFMIYAQDGSSVHLDTVNIQEGTFEADFALSHPKVMQMLLPNFSLYPFVAYPGQVVEIQGDAANLREMRITGNDDNDLLTAFRKSVLNRSLQDQTLSAAAFINQHPATLAAQALYIQYFLESDNPPLALTKQLIKHLQQANPQSPEVQSLARLTTNLLTTTSAKQLPRIPFTTVEGKSMNTSQFLGKPLFIFFWAQWNSKYPGVANLFNELEQKYGQRLQLLSISLDVDSALYHQGVGTTALPGYTVCDYKGFDSPYLSQFGVRYIPGNILVDAKGNILARDIASEQILGKISTLIP